MTNGQDQGDGMPGGGGMNHPTDPKAPAAVQQGGRQCVAPPMKITLTIEIGEGSSAASGDAKKQLGDLDKK
jgi:hypothetical protein